MYDVTLTLGEPGAYPHDQVAVSLQGAQVDVVSTAVGETATRTYTVTVADGRLTLRLRDLGGSNPWAVIAGLAVTSRLA